MTQTPLFKQGCLSHWSIGIKQFAPVNHGGHTHWYEPGKSIHVEFGWHDNGNKHSLIFTSQELPVQPIGHKHEYNPTLFIQVPSTCVYAKFYFNEKPKGKI